MHRIFAQTRVSGLIGLFRPQRVSCSCLFVLAALALTATPGAWAQTTWYVDDDAPNDPAPGDPTVSDPLEDGSADHPFDAIQEGIDAAVNGDTVLVLDGTYTGAGNRDMDFGGKAVTIGSENGPDGCIIDCDGTASDPHRGFRFHSGEGPDSVLSGFTITDGFGPDEWIIDRWETAGGAISCIASGPTIHNCSIIGNAAVTWSGYGSGGGLHCDGGAPRLSSCVFRANVAGYGAGVHNRGGSMIVENSVFFENEGKMGGGVYNYSADATFLSCKFIANLAHQIGGGTPGHGGALLNLEASPVLENCLFVMNGTDTWGGAVWVHSGAPLLINCTLFRNTASRDGGGLYTRSGFTATVVNSIIWDNDPDQLHGDVEVSYSCVQDGWLGAGNIDADPLFVRNPDPGPDGEWGTEDDDYGDLHLLAGSPCIDAADNFAVPNWILTDLDGMPRIWDDPDTPDTGQSHGHQPVVDMGAYEFGSEGCPDDDGDGLVRICHIPPGHPERARTITVPVRAAAAHLAHGDYCGPCDEDGGSHEWDEYEWFSYGGHWYALTLDGPDDDPNTWQDSDYRLSADSPCIDAGCICAVSEDYADLDADGDTEEYLPFDLDGEGRFFDDPDTPDSGSGVPPVVDMGGVRVRRERLAAVPW